MRNLKDNQFLYSLLLLAMLFRLPAVWDGLPAVYNSTEYFLAKIALNMGAHQSLDPLIYIYPTFYSYLLLALYGGYFIIGKIFGIFADRTAFAVQFLVQPASFYLLGRLVNMLISLACIYFLFIILKKYKGNFFAGLAATMAALCQSYIEFSGYAVSDTVLIFFSTLTVLFFLVTDQSPRLSYLFIQGLFCGLAIAAKYNAGFLAIGLCVGNYLLYRKYRLDFFKITLISFAGIAVGFLTTDPLVLIISGKYLEGFRHLTAQMGAAVSFEYGLNYFWELVQLLRTEWVIGFTFIAGTIFVLWKQPKQFLPHLFIVFLTFLYVGSWEKKGLDYLFTLYPIWILFGTACVEYMYTNFFKKEMYKNLIILLVVLPSLLLSAYHGILYLRQDTREELTQWLVNHEQSRQIYCYDYYHLDLGIFDIDRYAKYGAGSAYLTVEVKQELEKYRTSKLNISFIPIMYKDSTATYAGSNLYEKDESLYKRKSLQQLLAEGVTMLITNKPFYTTYQQVSIENFPPLIAQRIQEIREFYRQLDTGYVPFQIFKPGFWTRGPELKIYRLNQTLNHHLEP